MDNAVPVINDWIRPWSPIRCRISPMFFASKKRIGSLISLAIKVGNQGNALPGIHVQANPTLNKADSRLGD